MAHDELFNEYEDKLTPLLITELKEHLPSGVSASDLKKILEANQQMLNRMKK